MNVTEMQDLKGDWYWIPNGMVDSFKHDRGCEAYEMFRRKYQKYATEGNRHTEPVWYGQIDHSVTDGIICPYCGGVQDSSEYFEEDGDIFCGSCGTDFYYATHITIRYSTMRK